MNDANFFELKNFCLPCFEEQIFWYQYSDFEYDLNWVFGPVPNFELFDFAAVMYDSDWSADQKSFESNFRDFERLDFGFDLGVEFLMWTNQHF